VRDKELKLHDGEASHTLDAAGRGGYLWRGKRRGDQSPTHTRFLSGRGVCAWFVSGRGECVRVKR
jgi:hypothetical protein